MQSSPVIVRKTTTTKQVTREVIDRRKAEELLGEAPYAPWYQRLWGCPSPNAAERQIVIDDGRIIQGHRALRKIHLGNHSLEMKIIRYICEEVPPAVEARSPMPENSFEACEEEVLEEEGRREEALQEGLQATVLEEDEDEEDDWSDDPNDINYESSRHKKLKGLAARVDSGFRAKRNLTEEQKNACLKQHFEAVKIVEHLIYLRRGGAHTYHVNAPIVRAWYTQKREKLMVFVQIMTDGVVDEVSKALIGKHNISERAVSQVIRCKETLSNRTRCENHEEEEYDLVQQVLWSFLENGKNGKKKHCKDIFPIPTDPTYPKLNPPKKDSLSTEPRDPGTKSVEKTMVFTNVADKSGTGKLVGATMEEITRFTELWWNHFGDQVVTASVLRDLAEDYEIFDCMNKMVRENGPKGRSHFLAANILGTFFGYDNGTPDFYWFRSNWDEEDKKRSRSLYKLQKR